ncbi:MAG: Archaeal ribosome-binding protein aMBF1 [Candidatus Alkanophagales archaeon MCA70_species_1]|nr:Archaeal ribosome-binding protein aMBF1 [Candidatus Alkanophaga volatiphilum]
MAQQCEICGADVPHTYLVEIGTSKLRVCKACAKYGVVVTERQVKPSSVKTPVVRKKKIYKLMDEELSFEIVPDFGKRIKDAREKLGLKQEELAKQINEKVSLLRKIERGELVPEDRVRQKLERVLNISLVERVE